MDDSSHPKATAVARLLTDEPSALRIAGLLSERIDPQRTALAAFETADGWAVEIHFQDEPERDGLRALIRDAVGEQAAGRLAFETVAATDWVRASLDGLAPVEAGRFTIHGAHDRGRIGANRIGIEIEAALAFGTGHHGTTRGCLLALGIVARNRRPHNVLDVGTGSGVLAIAAARRLRRPVLATDIDRHSVAAARANARLNRAGTLVHVVETGGLDRKIVTARAPYDLVLANILLPTLRMLAAPIAGLTAPGGLVVLSGLLPAHAMAAIAAYRARGLRLVRRIACDGWITLILRRPPHKRQRPGSSIRGAERNRA